MRNQLISLVTGCALIGALGCGKVESNADSGANADANGADGSVSIPDANVDAQTHGDITVTVFINDVPAEAMSVFAHEADGSFIATHMTDANGEVTITNFPAGGAVTAPVNPWTSAGLRGFGFNGQFLTSVTGVQIGDSITFGKSVLAAGFGSGNTVGTATISLPVFAGADHYRTHIPCRDRYTGSTTSPLEAAVSIQEGCLYAGNTLDVLSYAEDSNDVRLGYSTQAGLGTTGTSPNLIASASLGSYATDLGTHTLNVLNAPVANMGVEAVEIGFRGGLMMDQVNLPGLLLAAGGNGAFVAKVAPGFFDASIFAVLANFGGKSGTSSSLVSILDSSSPTAAAPVTKNINLSTEVGQEISTIAATGTNPITATWTVGSLACKDNPTPDSVLTMITGRVEATPAVFGGPPTYNWVVLSPGGTPSGVAPPTIDPTLVATLWPEATFTTTTAGVTFRSDSSRDYDDFRNSDDVLSLIDFFPKNPSTMCFATAGNLQIFN